MRSKTSYFNKTVFWKNITHFWPVWLIYTILLLCMVPLRLLVNSGISYEGYSAQEIKEIKMNNFMQILFSDGSGALIALLSLAIGIIAAMAVFYYLYNNRSSHLFHSLPLKRTELFISNFLSGFCMIVVPVLLAFIIGTVCCIMQGITSLQYLLAWALMLTGESFFFYSMAIFVGMFTGQLLAMPVFTIILNVLYIGCRYVITCMISTIGYGMANSYADRMNSILSPVIYLSNKVGVEYDYLEDRIEYHMFGLSVVGIYVLVGVVLIVISCMLYQKRKLETTGDVLTIPATRPVFRWGMAFCVAFLTAILLSGLFGVLVHTSLGNFLMVLFTTLIAGFLAFFIAEMILTKKLRVVTKKRLLECGVMLGISVVFLFCIKWNAFGLENKIPDKKEIVAANINCYFDIEENSESGIDEIMSIHQQIIDSKKEFQAYQGSSDLDKALQWVEIDYQLADGSVMVRSYDVPAAKNYYENADSVVSRIYAMSMDPENYLKGNLMVNYDDPNNHIISMEFDAYDQNLEYDSININDERAQEIYDAYLKDIRAGHIYLNTVNDNYYKHTYINGLYLHVYNSQGIQLTRREQRMWGMENSKDYYFNLNLNDRCVYTINKLLELHIIESEDELMTLQEMEDRNMSMEQE